MSEHSENQLTQLIEYFRSEDGRSFGIEGDHRGWTPAETAIHFLKILSADSNVRFIHRTFDEARIRMNKDLDKLQRQLNQIGHEIEEDECS